MWLLRSVFWLSLMFVLMAPRGENPAEIPARLVSQGARAVSASLDNAPCADLTCAAGQAAIRSIIATAEAAMPPEPSQRLPRLETPAAILPAPDPSIPIPHPRPKRS